MSGLVSQPMPTGSGAQQAPTGIGAQQAPTGIGMQQAPTGIGAQQAPTGIGRQALPSSAPPPLQLATMRLPDEHTANPSSQDKTTVYRPKNKDKAVPKKKQSLALFVIGALAFAIVGFGIVYLVQLLVKSMGR